MRRTTAPLALSTTALATTALATTALLGLALLSPATAAAAETCRGEAATIVGSAGARIVGTEGRDVVVTDGSTRVATLGGDDLVCVDTTTAGRRHSRVVDIDAGAGDDVVDSTGTALPVSVRAVLGPGTDRFDGGDGSDTVAAGTADLTVVDDHDHPATHLDAEVDVLVGGGGWNHLLTGEDGVPNADVVVGGAHEDTITYAGPQHPAGRLEGGAQTDVLEVVLPPGPTSVDAAAGTMTTTAGGAGWTAIEDFEFVAHDAAARHLTYRGTDSPEEVRVNATGSLRLEVALAGGRDVLESVAPAEGSAIDAGAGRDALLVHARRGALDLDMRAATLEVAAGSGTHVVPAAGFEAALVVARRVTLAGTDHEDNLTAAACHAEVSGRRGEDFVQLLPVGAWTDGRDRCRSRSQLDGGAGDDDIISYGGARDTIRGGRGDDSLGGQRGADRLTGGPGRDAADGGPGADTCRAETEYLCER